LQIIVRVKLSNTNAKYYRIVIAIMQATNVKSEPQQRIHRLTNTYPSSSPFVGREPVRPMAMLTLQRIHSRHDDVTSGCDDKLGTETGGERQQADRTSPETGGDEAITNTVDDYNNALDSDSVRPLLPPGDVDKNKTKGTFLQT
jgi:hypothetical protein